jgi:hypothetical protein
LEVLPVPVHVAVAVEGAPETGPLELPGVELQVVLGEPAGKRPGAGKRSRSIVPRATVAMVAPPDADLTPSPDAAT